MELEPEQQQSKTDVIIDHFNELELDDVKPEVYRELESALEGAGYELADNNTAASVFRDSTLFCRHENFRRAIDLITTDEPISIQSPEHGPNMCVMAGGQGYKTAMLEGFGNREIAGKASVVISFSGTHLNSTTKVPKDDDLWVKKPETAAVSLAGEGAVTPDDIAMVSFRHPIRLYPEQMLTEREIDALENAGIEFVVRHFVPKQKTAH